MTNSPHLLTQLAAELPTRYLTVLPHLARVRLLTGAHLDRLLAHPDVTQETTARVRRRIMTRLHDVGLVTTLGRRIGGVRAGSAGHIYTLTSAGYRFWAILTGQAPPPRVRQCAPGVLFLAHTLAISDIYVRLIQTSGHHNVTMSSFVTEPECWQPTAGGNYLKPDAYCVLSATAHQDCWWLEIDQATESVPRIRTKSRAYLDFLTHGGVGPDHVPPRVLFTTPNTPRAHAIKETITKVSTQDSELLCVTTHAEAHTFLINQLLTT